MIHHIVLFSFEKCPEGISMEEFLKQTKAAFEELEALIPCLKEIKAHININPKEEYHLMLHGVLSDRSEIDVYAQHPEHVARVQKFIKPYVAKRACVDIED